MDWNIGAGGGIVTKQDLILQVNVPLCVRRCAYCSQTNGRYDPKLAAAYASALLREIEAVAPEMAGYRVRAVSIEGGSPALLESADLQRLIRAIRHAFNLAEDVQISLQTMPGDYSRTLMEKMRDNGVNFWIVGLETAERSEHEMLRRPYRFDALTMVDLALRTFHPRDLSFDLLCGIPGQTERGWMHSLETALAYEPDHLTLWPLSLAGNSAFQQQCVAGILEPMEPARREELRGCAAERLASLGYRAYTRVDFCRPGKEYRFRLGQIEGTEQLGLGYRAVTVMDGLTWINGHSLAEYLRSAGDYTVLANGVTALEGEAKAAYDRAREDMRGNS